MDNQKKLLIEVMEADEKDGLYKTNNMAQQTAVEWLIIQIKNDHIDKALTGLEWMKIFEQAKQMEKEQIAEAYLQGSFDDGPNQDNAEQYYNETYGNKN